MEQGPSDVCYISRMEGGWEGRKEERETGREEMKDRWTDGWQIINREANKIILENDK